jgi:hypothetical protein
MIDPREKAAECERAIEACTDPERKFALTCLRDLWVAVADDRDRGRPDWHAQAESIDKVHADTLKPQE